jgi:hypothetical protein
MAKLTLTLADIICVDKISASFDQEPSAIVTIRVVALMIGHIPHIYIVQTGLHGHASKTGQNRDRCGRQAVEFVFGEKA